MGTSGSSRGPASGTPLVPTWLSEPNNEPLPGNDQTAADGATDGGDQADNNAQSDTNQQPREAPIQPAAISARFQSARRNFSSFAGSGGNDRGAMKRAVRDYVRTGTGGSANATRRMGASRAAAGNVLGVFRGFQRAGVTQTLQYLNLANLVGRPPADILVGLTDVICEDGGSIDEGIARDAWLETAAEIDQLGVEDFAALTVEQMQEIFVTFVGHAIEKRLFQDIGIKGIRIAENLEAIAAFEAQFRDYVKRSVRDSFSSDVNDLQGLSDREIRNMVDRTYREAWELLELWGDAEG